MADCDWPRSTFTVIRGPLRKIKHILKNKMAKTKCNKITIYSVIIKDNCKWLLVEKKEYINLKLLRMLLTETKF